MSTTLFPGRRNDRHLDVLGRVSLFRACRREELAHIAALTTEISVEKGRMLCRAGDTGRECFIVVDGEAVVRIGDIRVATIGPGGFFGEMALLDGGPRVADVVAVSPMTLLVLGKAELASLLESAPTVGMKMLKALGVRLRRAETGSPIMPIV